MTEAASGLRFEVLAEVAVGTTARIDLCRTLAPVTGQLIAVKRLLPELAADPSVASRFLDEVWMTSALRHSNVVGVVGWGNDERGAFLAVELVQGVSLARLMKTVTDTREEFPERLVVYIGASIARGLAAAHDLMNERGELYGIIHRDLGLQNVLVGFNGDVKIADFGLALAKNRLTHTTSALPARSISHLSPEELRGETINQRADLYGVGVIVYELLTGHTVYQGKDEIETLRNIMNQPVPDPLRARPKIDKSLAQLVRQCLDKDPRLRPKSAAEIAQRLDGWLFAHGYRDDNVEALGRFVRRNAMRQMRWFERVIAGREAAVDNESGPQPAVPRPAPTRDEQSKVSRDSAPTRDTETTVVEQGKKVTLPTKRARPSEPAPSQGTPLRARREGLRSPPSTAPVSRPNVPRLNEDDDDEEEGENIPTVAVKRGDVMKALIDHAVVDPTKAPVTGPQPQATRPAEKPPEETSHRRPTEPMMERPPSFSEITSDSIELITEDPSTDNPVQTEVLKRPLIPPVPSRREPPPVPRASAPPPPPAPRQTSSSIESATMTMPNQLLAPEYIAHQVERLRGNALKKTTEARAAREEADEAVREAEEAEEQSRLAEGAVAMALEALQLAKDGKTSLAAEKLEEALMLTDGPPRSLRE